MASFITQQYLIIALIQGFLGHLNDVLDQRLIVIVGHVLNKTQRIEFGWQVDHPLYVLKNL